MGVEKIHIKGQTGHIVTLPIEEGGSKLSSIMVMQVVFTVHLGLMYRLRKMILWKNFHCNENPLKLQSSRNQ